MIIGGKSGGKMLAQRLAIRQQVILEGHMHVAALDGLWCVTGTPEQVATLGVLWQKLRQSCPDKRPARSRDIYRQALQRMPVIYDEMAQWEASREG